MHVIVHVLILSCYQVTWQIIYSLLELHLDQ